RRIFVEPDAEAVTHEVDVKRIASLLRVPRGIDRKGFRCHAWYRIPHDLPLNVNYTSPHFPLQVTRFPGHRHAGIVTVVTAEQADHVDGHSVAILNLVLTG